MNDHRMEVFDDPEYSTIVAQVEVPGVKTSDISFRIHNDCVIISGERHPTFAIGKRRDRYVPMSAATDSGTEPQTTEAQENNFSTRLPAPKNNFPVQELKYGKFLREISIPTGLHVSHRHSVTHWGRVMT
jgi:HSP20 family protein